ncbi:hypothetical protein COO91_07746 [Nostoc flagelliforme CCNUN1]|uniref:Uncharacterized protein n=1 Tax=Nostoc flagelliforme CCNUN1 TaxID=2038116 RepID=A0A2K8T1W8_9NOSO|nr:hypothetical protein COO91_07746 [Nostoc flagelliforme CCNUN1]
MKTLPHLGLSQARTKTFFGMVMPISSKSFAKFGNSESGNVPPLKEA